MLSILDVGCGDGQFLKWLPNAYRKVGLDFSYGPLTSLPGVGVQGAVEALPFPDRSFDLITAFEVLEHLSEKTFASALRELERVSRKYIIISVPNREVLAESLVWCPRCSCAFHPSWHVRSFDEAALGTLFPDFRMTECRAVGPAARYSGSRLGILVVLIARRNPPPVVVCPQCEYSRAAPDSSLEENGRVCSSEPPSLLRAMFRWLVRTFVFRERRPYWLLATYVRES
ncbi:MAG: methyltransferase domain-containing protein [Armatimonadota bacterium]|nr:methyltransferase domain-containing protein [Armatimonadota bacterium]MDR7550725.1 methyltransferase domain-containing protein [Armatimonadota bacterium]